MDPELLYPGHNFSVPIDHLHNDSRYEPHSDGTFNLRYFFDATYYKPGGPVFVLQSGETDATGRLPYLQKGIIAQLSQATNGLGVILEHRYYGTSFPVDDLSVDNLRFLTTQQALADQAYFQQNVVFPGMEDMDLTAPGTPWIAYGGSYAGGFVAFLRKLYPESTWGAISSSGVTEAIYDYWEYYEPIRTYGPPECVMTQQKLIDVVDNILMNNETSSRDSLKAAFQMEDVTYDDDFAAILSDVFFGEGMIGWQSRNWDPAVGAPNFDYWCGNITSNEVLWPGTSELASNVTTLIEAAGWGNESETLTNPMLNFIGYINDSYVATCETTLDECYSYHNASAAYFSDHSIENQGYISWPWQYCTQWGYIQPGSTVPEDIMPIVSRLVTLEYLTAPCRLAFNLTEPPKVEEINQYGGFNITYPRLAHIGGETDPWRPASPLATREEPTVLNHTSTVSEPIIMIEGAVHHWVRDSRYTYVAGMHFSPRPSC